MRQIDINVDTFVNPMDYLKRCSVKDCTEDVVCYVRIGGGTAEYSDMVHTVACFCGGHIKEYTPIINKWWNGLFAPVLDITLVGKESSSGG